MARNLWGLPASVAMSLECSLKIEVFVQGTFRRGQLIDMHRSEFLHLFSLGLCNVFHPDNRFAFDARSAPILQELFP